MYSFLFGFFYTKLKERNHETPRLGTSVVVFVAIWMHVFCILAMLKYFGIYDFMSEANLTAKYSTLPIILFFMVGVYLYFSPKRIKKTLNSYQGERIHSFKNILFVVFIYLIPLSVFISFTL